jgi:hypothetical protein
LISLWKQWADCFHVTHSAKFAISYGAFWLLCVPIRCTRPWCLTHLLTVWNLAALLFSWKNCMNAHPFTVTIETDICNPCSLNSNTNHRSFYLTGSSINLGPWKTLLADRWAAFTASCSWWHSLPILGILYVWCWLHAFLIDFAPATCQPSLLTLWPDWADYPSMVAMFGPQSSRPTPMPWNCVSTWHQSRNHYYLNIRNTTGVGGWQWGGEDGRGAQCNHFLGLNTPISFLFCCLLVADFNLPPNPDLS